MNKAIFLNVFSALLFLSACGPSNELKTLRDESGKFSIEIPVGYEKVKRSYQNVAWTFYQVEPADVANLFYAVGYGDYPAEWIDSDSLMDIEEKLEGILFEYLQKNQEVPVQILPKTISGYPGRQIRARRLNTQQFSTHRVFAVWNRVYWLQVYSEGDKVQNQALSDFLDSFRPIGVAEREPPYLNMPTDEELANLPYEIDFQGATERQVQVAEFDDHKYSIIVTMNIVDDPDRTGVLTLGVLCSQWKWMDSLNVDVMDGILQQQKQALLPNFPGGKVKPEVPIISDDWRGYIVEFSYKLNGMQIRDIRHFLFLPASKWSVQLVALTIADKPLHERVEDFFESFNIREIAQPNP